MTLHNDYKLRIMNNTTLNVKNILVTGSSGVLGADLLPEIRIRYPDATITTVTRSSVGSFHKANTKHISHDLTSPLSRNEALLEAIKAADLIVHLAANVSWILAAEDSLEANTTSTRRLLGYCKQHAKNLKRFIHVSTAYVQDRSLTELTIEADDRNGDFKNNYELSKYMSVVAGDPKTTVDIVTLDKVTLSILAAMNTNNEQKLYWAASFDKSPTVQLIMETIQSRVNTYREARELTLLDTPIFIEIQHWTNQVRPALMKASNASMRRMISYLDVFVPYFSSYGQFKASSNDHVVEQAATADHYLPAVIDFWCANNKKIVLRNKKLKAFESNHF